MKKILTIALLVTASLLNAQAFKGKGDKKFSVGANFQDDGTGIQFAYDFGVGQNISFGFMGTYLMSISKNPIQSPEFEDEFDFKFRFNANLADVIKVDNLDVYPGLNIGLRNFGGHLGARYMLSDGFGLFSEAVFPIAKYENNIDKLDYDHLNNQFTFNIGAVFNLN